MPQKRWLKLKLISIDCEQLIMDCFDCIFISSDGLAYLIPMFSLVSRFLRLREMHNALQLPRFFFFSSFSFFS